MKKSLINNYLAALKTLINDNCITFVITGNFNLYDFVWEYYDYSSRFWSFKKCSFFMWAM